MRLTLPGNTAKFISKAGAAIVVTAAATTAAPAWAHHRPHNLHREPGHRRVALDAHPQPKRGFVHSPDEDSTPLVVQDMGSSPVATAEPQTEVADESTTALERVQEKAMSLVGVRYRYGGSSPLSGFDCSGFVQYVMRHAAGLQLGRTAASQATAGQQVGRSNLKLGDLVFFHTYGRGISHVGLYLGHGKFVHAPSSGGHVRVERLDDPYWHVHYVKAERLSDAQFRQD
ncbi:cell wall-associated NlpC family hydrolase [Paraburkholderia sp. HC6.4b]|uniref:C40 family peptidase n=1 Tax=unclassified Paraburkholderia TaxID=2615204 RepID=UPI0018118E0B|nr:MULTISPECIES: C40 family peptidase [unclassified Paraburkholderia]MBB5409275.1 cell wall-associated NlpC family hydrolase [Paraburkholderia sp. HC6.4b]MBB5451003.1 cell wall-associated NlpC family hydrolase [Paraburkholderia sp. Kb1A]